ncbi:T9SS type A sorting domain-containing protein [Marixanthomonas sp. SCSIO 43207]|uniref:T9SS type A sorting domain-containing protein n=1 Tax=Marixanthomonas sp. SCSIO 43207 TaxID=2779360 RepID=UPI001CA9CF50|nr:T9SS type A sorting domain-containing protein [Marixanthomonas sp. SCSIO 43207]UAB82395.1 T9SS type A sorting domain-containing protein [Marixanthomonas sp. SCSIO 43207]
MNYVLEGTLGFMVESPTNIEDNGLYLLDIESGDVIKYVVPIPLNAENIFMNSYSVYKQDPSIAMLSLEYRVSGVGSKIVYYTNDSGINWSEIYLADNYNSVAVNSVAINPTNPQNLFIARGQSPNETYGGLLESNDAGQTWIEKMPGITFDPIIFHPQDSDTIFLGTGIGRRDGSHSENLYRSVDGGDTWSILPITWENGILDNIVTIVINPQDPATMIVLEENEIVVTQDDWQTFDKYVHPIGSPDGYYYGLNASFNPFQQGEVFINSNFYPLLSSDYGASFNQFFNPFFPSNFTEVQEDDSEMHLYYGAQQGLVRKNLLTNEIEATDIVSLDVFSNDAPAFYHIHKSMVGRIYKYKSSFLGSNLSVSNDFGRNYDVLYTNFFDDIRSINQDPINPNIVWASFLNGGTVILDFTDINNVIQTNVILPDANPIRDVYFDEENPNSLFVASGSKVHYSEDYGVSWIEKSNGLPENNTIYDIARSPFNSNEYTIATETGIYKTIDQGENWLQTYQGAYIKKIAYSEYSEKDAVASKMTRQPLFGEAVDAQIIYTTDGGSSWEEVPLEAINHTGALSMSYKFHENSVDVYMATLDLGLTKHTIDLTSLEVSNSFQNTNTFIVYPNPVQDIINVEENGNQVASITIYNSIGQQVMANLTENQIRVEHLESGIYFISIENVNGESFIKRFVKN